MKNLSHLNPHERFTGLAEIYAQYRPDYPATALDWIVDFCGLAPGKQVVDVGSGTGIFSRLLARRGLDVIGVEPNASMRTQAEATPPRTDEAPIRYQPGNAEQTGLPEKCADAVFAAQAFHWFDAPRALAEFRRVLRPAGWVVLIWNERDESDAFAGAYGAVLRSTPEGPSMEKARHGAGQALLESPLFHEARRQSFAHQQVFNEEQMIGRALSVSYAPKAPADIDAHLAKLRDVFARYQTNGRVVLPYVTSVFVARKSP